MHKSTVDRVRQRYLKPDSWEDGSPRKRDATENDWHWSRAAGLAKSVGMSVERYPKTISPEVQWDGKTAFSDTAYNLIHEVAHFQVAEGERRWMKNYGLGSGPDDKYSASAVVEDSAKEEAYASLLGILWEARLNFPYSQTLSFHDWYCEWDEKAEGFDKMVEQLQKWGLIKNGEPVRNLRGSDK